MGTKELQSSERNRNRHCRSGDWSEGSNRFGRTQRALARKGNALSACREDSARVSTNATSARAISAKNTETFLHSVYSIYFKPKPPIDCGPAWPTRACPSFFVFKPAAVKRLSDGTLKAGDYCRTPRDLLARKPVNADSNLQKTETPDTDTLAWPTHSKG
jgi:hypothetical protein